MGGTVSPATGWMLMWYSDLGFAGVRVFRCSGYWTFGCSGVRVFGLEPRRVGEALGAFEAEIPIPPPLLWGGAGGPALRTVSGAYLHWCELMRTWLDNPEATLCHATTIWVSRGSLIF